MKEYQQHPLSAAFPGMSTEQHEALIQDIEAVGLRDPITLYEGMVLDGWHRYQASRMLGLQDVRFVEYEGPDPAGFVLSKNLQRRHLDASQRAFSLARLVDWQEGAGRPSRSVLRAQEFGNFSELSAAETAKQIGVSDKTVLQARAATRAIPEIQQAVQDGDMSVYEASKLAKLPAAEQAAALSKPVKPRPQKQMRIPMVPLEEYQMLETNYIALSQELAACSAVKENREVEELHKLQRSLNSMTAARDQWQNKCAEMTRQNNYLSSRVKKLESELTTLKR